MNKKGWQEGLERIKESYDTALKNLEVSKKNVIIVEGQVEESKFMVESYKAKIKTFK